ncbi:MAG: YdjY domain-containing protein [Planctomycetota bacterium]
MLAFLLFAALLQPATKPAEAPAIFELPHVRADLDARQLRIAAESLALDVPLEFVCVVAGTADHETVVRTLARPSDIHAAALVLGLEPGQPIRWSPAKQEFLPPAGPPVRISVEWATPAGDVTKPVEQLIRRIDNGEPMPPRTFAFVGSRTAPDGTYVADVTGQIVSLVNFEHTVFDVPQLASDSNELLEWELNPVTAPPGGTAVTLIIEPIGDEASLPNTKQKAVSLDEPIGVDQARVDALTRQWEAAVLPGADSVRLAAQTHYDVIAALRAEQDRLIAEADRLQRVIDELDRKYQDLVTPRPGPTTQPGGE